MDLPKGYIGGICNGRNFLKNERGRRGRMVVGFTTTYAISAYHHYEIVICIF